MLTSRLANASGIEILFRKHRKLGRLGRHAGGGDRRIVIELQRHGDRSATGSSGRRHRRRRQQRGRAGIDSTVERLARHSEQRAMHHFCLGLDEIDPLGFDLLEHFRLGVAVHDARRQEDE
jgi:hypothetical protein